MDMITTFFIACFGLVFLLIVIRGLSGSGKPKGDEETLLEQRDAAFLNDGTMHSNRQNDAYLAAGASTLFIQEEMNNELQQPDSDSRQQYDATDTFDNSSVDDYSSDSSSSDSSSSFD